MLDHDVNLIAVLHVELLGSLRLVEAFTIEEEADVGGAELYVRLDTLWRWQ